MKHEFPELAPYPIVCEVAVHWGDMDAFQHVNNVRYFGYLEVARIKYAHDIVQPDIPFAGTPDGVGPILASTTCKFVAPMTYPDTVLVGCRVTDVGEDRFTQELLLISRKMKRVVAKAECVTVAFDYGSKTKAKVPQSWRRNIAAAEGE